MVILLFESWPLIILVILISPIGLSLGLSSNGGRVAIWRVFCRLTSISQTRLRSGCPRSSPGLLPLIGHAASGSLVHLSVHLVPLLEELNGIGITWILFLVSLASLVIWLHIFYYCF